MSGGEGQRGFGEAAVPLEAGSGIADRLRQAVAAAGSQAALAARAGISERSIQYLLAGQDPKLSQLAKIAAASGLALHWLVTGQDPHAPAPPPAPQSATPAQALVADQVMVRPLAQTSPPGLLVASFDRAWLERELGRPADRLALFPVTGDAMSPGMRDGDVVMVDRSAIELCSGRLYLVDLAGELQLRRIQRRLTGALLLICDNDRYPPEEVRPEGPQLRILGEVVWHGRVV